MSPDMAKNNKTNVCRVKTDQPGQIVQSIDSDQPGLLPRLIRVFAEN